MRVSRREIDWLAAHAFFTVLQSAAYQPLRRGRAHEAIQIAIDQLQRLLEAPLPGRRGASEGVVDEVPEKERRWLLRIARAAYDKQLRSLRC